MTPEERAEKIWEWIAGADRNIPTIEIHAFVAVQIREACRAAEEEANIKGYELGKAGGKLALNNAYDRGVRAGQEKMRDNILFIITNPSNYFNSYGEIADKIRATKEEAVEKSLAERLTMPTAEVEEIQRQERDEWIAEGFRSGQEKMREEAAKIPDEHSYDDDCIWHCAIRISIQIRALAISEVEKCICKICHNPQHPQYGQNVQCSCCRVSK